VTPPETTITAAPPARTASAAPSFSFTSSEAASTFECRMDSGAFGACASPKSYAGLIDGAHTFSVRATDAAANTDPTPAQAAFTVDTTGPDTSITQAPPPLTAAAVQIAFASPEVGATFECRLDNAAFAACTSPWSSGPLADGRTRSPSAPSTTWATATRRRRPPPGRSTRRHRTPRSPAGRLPRPRHHADVPVHRHRGRLGVPVPGRRGRLDRVHESADDGRARRRRAPRSASARPIPPATPTPVRRSQRSPSTRRCPT